MRLLLDTHTFLWFLLRQPTGERFYELCLDPSNELYLSAASYWEICIKAGLGKLRLSDEWRAVFDREIALNGINWLPIEKSHCQELLALPRPEQVAGHRDPFDRLLIAQARAEGLSVLSADPHFGRYNVPVVW